MKKNHLFCEILGFGLLSLGVFFLLSLVSYCPPDYGEDIFPPHLYNHNLCGSMGAMLSRTIFVWLGQTSGFFLGSFFVLWGGWLFLKRWHHVSLGGVGLLAFTLSMLEAEFGWFQIYTTLPPGGKYGIFFVAFLKGHFPFWGRYLLLLGMFSLSCFWILVGPTEENIDGEGEEKSTGQTSRVLPVPSPLFSPHLTDILSNPSREFQMSLGSLLDNPNHIQRANFTHSQALLVAGENSQDLNRVLDGLLIPLFLQHTPEEFKVLLLDSRGQLKKYQKIPHLLRPVLRDWSKLESLLSMLDGEMDQRKGQKKPFILLVIEELGELMLSLPQEMERFFKKLSQSSQGVFALLATTRPSLDVLTPPVQNLCGYRLALKVSSKIESTILLQKAGAEKLPPSQAIFWDKAKNNPLTIQLPPFQESEIQRALQHLAPKDKGLKSAQPKKAS